MFFGKKTKDSAINQMDANMKMNHMFKSLATSLYHDVAGNKPGLTLDATLEFDRQQRISNLTNVTVDGLPKIPSFEVIETMNNVSVDTLSSLPEIYKLKALKLNIAANSSFDAAPTYLK